MTSTPHEYASAVLYAPYITWDLLPSYILFVRALPNVKKIDLYYVPEVSEKFPYALKINELTLVIFSSPPPVTITT